jgi:RND family efflux transporter MFP subunit
MSRGEVRTASRQRHPALWAACLASMPLLLLLGCGEEPEEAPTAPVARPIKITVVGDLGPQNYTEYPGRIVAFQHAEMAFEVPGKIIDFPFVEGDRIEKGTVIARLDPRDFNANLQAAKANLAQAKADYLRYQTLLEEGVASQAEFEAKEQGYKVREAEMQSAEKAIEDANLIAPFTGSYAKKLVDDFQNVRAKQPVLILQDDSRLKIVVSVPEADMAGGAERTTNEDITRQIKPRVVLSSRPAQPIDVALYELATTADPMTRTFDATFVMDNPKDVNVLPGMTAKITVEYPLSDLSGTRIPGHAVFADEQGSTYVWVVDPETWTVSIRPVTIGAPQGDRLEIHEGLTPGEIIATSGIGSLQEGMLVKEYVP